MANLAMKHLFAWRIGDVKIEVLAKAVALPEGQRAGMLLVITSCDKGIAGAQRLGHVLYQTLEEVAARGRRCAHYEKLECLLGPFLFADITDKTSKYSMPVPDLLSEGNLQRELFAILPHADQFSSLPVDMPLASRQVTLEPSLV